MHNNFSRPLGVIDLQFSKTYFFLLMIFYLGAIACVFASAMPFSVKLALSFFCLAHLWYQFFWPIKFIAFGQQDDHWFVIDANGEKHFGNIQGDSIRTSRFVLLNFKLLAGQRKRVSVPVFFDSVPADDFRRLKVSLL